MTVYIAYMQCHFQNGEVLGVHQSIEGAWGTVIQEMKTRHPEGIDRVGSTKFCGAVWLSDVSYRVIEHEVLP